MLGILVPGQVVLANRVGNARVLQGAAGVLSVGEATPYQTGRPREPSDSRTRADFGRSRTISPLAEALMQAHEAHR
jgi:hypothetical protein